MAFKQLFDRFRTYSKSQENQTADKGQIVTTAPPIQYVHTAQNRDHSSNTDSRVLVLWWISKKKSGYDWTTNKYPKWFIEQYGIDFNNCVNKYLSCGLLLNDNNIIMITPAGESEINKYDYIIYIHEHPQYCLSINDFKTSSSLHTVQNSDIAWQILNSRVLQYTNNRMWSSLSANFGNMADLLVEEKRYEQALDFVFASAYLDTSGMKDGNELTPIFAEPSRSGYKNRYLKNGMPDIFCLEINNYQVTAPFLKIQKKLNLDWQDIWCRFTQSTIIHSLEDCLPFKYFEKEQSFAIFKAAIEEGNKKGVFPLAHCSQSLKWNTPNEQSRTYFYASVKNEMRRMQS